MQTLNLERSANRRDGRFGPVLQLRGNRRLRRDRRSPPQSEHYCSEIHRAPRVTKMLSLQRTV
jgi:hypothetical protein